MSNRIFLRNLILAGFVSLSAGLAQAHPTAEEPDLAGLTQIQNPKFDEVWLKGNSALSGYSNIYIEEPEISLRKGWKRDQNRFDPNRITQRDIDRIKSNLAELTVTVFQGQLRKDGFKVVPEPGPKTLILRPNIVDLDIAAPDSSAPGRRFSYAQSAGEFTLLLNLRDGSSNEVIGQVRDRKRDPRRNVFEWRNRVTNEATARRMLRSWARDLGAELASHPWEQPVAVGP